MNVMKFIREKKEAIKDYSKKRDFEADLRRQKELKELKKQKAYYERKEEFNKIKSEVRDLKTAPLKRFAKAMGKNVHQANKTLKKEGKKTKPIPFGQRQTRWG